MVVHKKPMLRKYDRSAKTGELYGPRKRPEDTTPEHNEEVTAKVKRLREDNAGKDMVFFEVRCPRPDIIQVDYEKKEITAWELSKVDQVTEKRKLYQNHSEWSHVRITQIEKGIGKKTTFLWRQSRYRRGKKNVKKEIHV